MARGSAVKGMSTWDVIIVGCGMAGASLAYFLSQRGLDRILILEREEQPGYHATGRSAAVLVEFDLVPSVLELKMLGGAFFRDQPEGFSEQRILHQDGILILFEEALWKGARDALMRLERGGVVAEALSREEALRLVPVLSPACFKRALYLPRDGHLDVHELLWSYLRHARARGAELRLGEGVQGILTRGDRCLGVRTARGEYHAPWVVNACGAWGKALRALAGPSPVHLTPYRRTVVTFAHPPDLPQGPWPFTINLSVGLYFGPESAGHLASPMDEDPVAPCDAKAEEWSVALAMARLEQVAPALVPRGISHKWAGLRTFAPDQGMVVGEDPELQGLFWLCGQGGAGIETSPAVGALAADLLLEGDTRVMDAAQLSPARFYQGGIS